MRRVADKLAEKSRLKPKEDTVPACCRGLTPNAETRAAMRELEIGGGAHFEDISSLMADLNADD